jgi:DNA-binding NarL/FixJ family response regulator
MVGNRTSPRFAVIEPAGSRVGTRLATIGWIASASVTEASALEPEAMTRCDVVVVVCAERELLSPRVLVDLERIASRLPRVVVVSSPSTEAAASAARLGWSGFVSATSSTQVIARTIAVAAQGELAFPASAITSLARALARTAPASLPSQALTPRQQQIVALIAEGATDAEIAERLRISRFTAHKHVQNARRRLGAKTRGQLVAASQVR